MESSEVLVHNGVEVFRVLHSLLVESLLVALNMAGEEFFALALCPVTLKLYSTRSDLGIAKHRKKLPCVRTS
jgi:hypothetical protein